MPDPIDDVCEACAAAWADGEERMRTGKQLGLRIDDKTAALIATWLDIANAGERRKYKLALVDVVRAIAVAASSEIGLAVRHGGKGGPQATAPTTIVLAVKPADVDEVAVGIGACPARSASPGATWKELAPWQAEPARNIAKAQLWASDPARVLRIPIVARARLSLRQSRVARNALLAEIVAKPDDDAPRLVYADWLTQRGDPRGELITVQCALAANTPGIDQARLARREKQLVRAHGADWTREVRQVARACTLRRGFVGAVEVTAKVFATKLGALMEREPIDDVTLVDQSGRDLAAIARAPHLARVRRLVVDGSLWIGTRTQWEGLCALVRALPAARELVAYIRYDADLDDDLPTLFAGAELPALERLELTLVRRGVSDSPTRALIAKRAWGSLARAHAPKLRTLVLEPLDERAPVVAAFPGARVTRPR